MRTIKQELQDSLLESGNEYTLKTDEEVIEIISDFGCGYLEFHSVNINRIIVENIRMKKLLNITEI